MHLEVKILRYSRFENLFVAVVVKIIFVREQIQKMSQHHINGMEWGDTIQQTVFNKMNPLQF